MIFPLLLLAAAQTAASTPATRPGKPFMSPMGEPVFGRAHNEDGLVAWFAETDTNHDGILTADEMAADAEHFFEQLDVDHDGEIGPEEIERYETQIAPQVRVRYDMGGDSSGAAVSAEAIAGRYGLLQIPEPVMAADLNFNRGISAEEFRQAAITRFGLLDASHSGRLTLPQLQSVRQAAIGASRRRVVQPNTDTTEGQGIGQSVVPPDQQ
jgi:Ca2+-binding EF-hand superfamily protein